MEGKLHAESFDQDWEDKNVKIHEIKVDNVEITEDDDVQRIDTRPKRDGPAWKVGDDESEVKVIEAPTKGTYRPGGFHGKKAPTKDSQNFPDINTVTSEKKNPDETSHRHDEQAHGKDHKSSNRFEQLDNEEIPVDPEEIKLPEKVQQVEKPRKKPTKKAKKDKWKQLETHIKIATTEAELEKNIFEKTEEKVMPFDHGEKPRYERSFPVSKPGDGMFRNYDNKPKVESSPFVSKNSDEGVKFGRKMDSNFPVRSTEDNEKPFNWRSAADEKKETEGSTGGPSEPPKKKYFNAKKQTQDPLKPVEQDQKKPNEDVWGEKVKTERANAWKK